MIQDKVKSRTNQLQFALIKQIYDLEKRRKRLQQRYGAMSSVYAVKSGPITRKLSSLYRSKRRFDGYMEKIKRFQKWMAIFFQLPQKTLWNKGQEKGSYVLVRKFFCKHAYEVEELENKYVAEWLGIHPKHVPAIRRKFEQELQQDPTIFSLYLEWLNAYQWNIRWVEWQQNSQPKNDHNDTEISNKRKRQARNDNAKRPADRKSSGSSPLTPIRIDAPLVPRRA